MSGRPLVLVVDDDADTREAMQLLLEAEGYDVEVAPDGHAALRRLRVDPLPGLMLLDLHMPGIDGRAVIETLESSPDLPGVPIVLLTAASPNEGTAALPYPLLRKPISTDDFLRVVASQCPRLWDEIEPPTDEDSVRGLAGFSDTARDRCSTCRERRASTRCRGCGEAFCKVCLDAGPDGRCAVCWRRAHP